MKDYRFNFGFLSEWMRENNMTKRDVLNAIGSKDYAGLNDWIAGERPMHIEAILRLCNTFNIPLGCWFFDNNARADIEPPRPGIDDRTESSSDKKRGKGARATPIGVTATFNQDSRIPAARQVAPSVIEVPVTDEVKTLQMQLDYERKINDLKDRHNERIDELRRNYEQKFNSRDAMVESQQQEIMALRKELREQKGYGYGGTIAAEDQSFKRG